MDAIPKMKLFVWNEPYGIAYGSSCLFVVAQTEEGAREKARDAKTSPFGLDPNDGNQLPDDLGPPTRVIDAPCAEVYYWSE